MPENIARLLTILRALLAFGRHIAAMLERGATAPALELLSALFGTVSVPVIQAHLRRGIVRAAALESLLLQRAAAGQDVPAPRRTPAVPGAQPDPDEEPFDVQAARLIAERARHDVPVDPASLASAETIEAEVHAWPIGRTVDAVRRDIGAIPMLCATGFWDAMTDAIARYADSAAWLEETQSRLVALHQAQDADPEPRQKERRPRVGCQSSVHPEPGAAVGTETVLGPDAKQPIRAADPRSVAEESQPAVRADDRDRLVAALTLMLLVAALSSSPDLNRCRSLPSRRDDRLLAWSRKNIPASKRHAATAATATGPPSRAMMRLAA